MIAAAISRNPLLPVLTVLAVLTLAGGCARPPSLGMTPLRPATLAELQGYLLANKPDVELFRLRGPFAVVVQEDHEIRLSATERVTADVFSSVLPEKAPLVIFVHGHDASKEDHGYQAMHLASWGMHCLSVQLPNKGPWIGNGKVLARIINAIYRSPGIVDQRVDASRIILVGHSFGAASVAVALAEGAPAAGSILLDPATINKDLPGFLKRVKKPVLVLGADEYVFTARNRANFYRFIPGGIGEVSIRNANHEDAQFPADVAQQHPLASEEQQVTFVSAIAAAAFSLALTGKFDYAWTSFGEGVDSGRFLNARKK